MTAALPPSRRIGIAGTTIAHGALIAAALVAASRSNRKGPLVYEVNLVAAPMAATGPAKTVTPEQPAPKAVAPIAKPKIKAPAPKVPVKTKAADPAPVVKPANKPLAGVAPSKGQDVVTLHQDGLDFPYKEYLARIQNEIYKRWDQSGFRNGLHVSIAFVITRDGTVPENSISVEVHSGSGRFDDQAQAAIEAASFTKAFGPLPTGFTSASLPILFNFTMTPKSPE